MANYKTIFKHPIIGLKVGVDENNKAHLLKLFNREVEGNDSPTPTPESNLDNGEGTYSLKQKAFLSNNVDGNNSVALGGANTVDGNLSFAVGSTNRVSNDACVALGVGLTSDADNQVLLGEYNVTNPNATLILGIGEQETDKLNAVEVLNDGSVYVKGVGNYDGTNSDDEDVKDLATVINESGGGSADSNIIYLGYGSGSWSSIFATTARSGMSPIIITADIAKQITNSLSSILCFSCYVNSSRNTICCTNFTYSTNNYKYTITFSYFGSSNTARDVCTITGDLSGTEPSSVISVNITLAS